MRRPPGRTRILLSVAILIVLVVVLFVVAHQATAPAGEPAPTQHAALDPQIIANLTQLPKATALAGQQANDMAGLRALVAACPAYDEERRQTMNQQIDVIVNPAQLDPQTIVMLGANPRGKLLQGLGSITANVWQLNGKPGDSCLIPIGKRINELLVADGAPPVAAFEEGSS
jgi:hypothetical protein